AEAQIVTGEKETAKQENSQKEHEYSIDDLLGRRDLDWKHSLRLCPWTDNFETHRPSAICGSFNPNRNSRRIGQRALPRCAGVGVMQRSPLRIDGLPLRRIETCFGKECRPIRRRRRS